MPSLRGERFAVDLPAAADGGDGSDGDVGASLMVTDVLERPSATSSAPPSAPSMKSQSGGFPRHRNRLRASKPKSESSDRLSHPLEAVNSHVRKTELDSDSLDERTAIDRENQQRIEQMTDEDIAKAQQELRDSLDPSLIAYLSRRPLELRRQDKVTESTEAASETSPSAAAGPLTSSVGALQDVHFPKPPQPRDLDPNADSFFEDLHDKYFAQLPAEPEKLAWMKPSAESGYSPEQESVHVSSIRFDFRGAIVPPRLAAAIPVTRGLHHHAVAPESAGYTIPELAHLARSTVPMQRCVAFQTLGRVLFRLGKGLFGPRDERIPRMLSQMLKECRVVETLQEEAGKKDGHLSAKNYATEALWLWHRSGGREFKAG